MAIDNDDAVELLHIAFRTLQCSCPEMRIAELGDQFVKGFGAGRTLAKHVFAVLGAAHTSFDLNGKGGAEVVDLGSRIPVKWHGMFDLVTNFGTSEHVASNPDAQRWCFHNVDALCRIGGAMVHYVPHVDCSRHGVYHYQCDYFFRLAEVMQYEIVLLDKRPKWNRRIADPDEQHDHYVRAVFRKCVNRAVPVDAIDIMPTHASLRKGVTT